MVMNLYVRYVNELFVTKPLCEPMMTYCLANLLGTYFKAFGYVYVLQENTFENVCKHAIFSGV